MTQRIDIVYVYLQCNASITLNCYQALSFFFSFRRSAKFGGRPKKKGRRIARWKVSIAQTHAQAEGSRVKVNTNKRDNISTIPTSRKGRILIFELMLASRLPFPLSKKSTLMLELKLELVFALLLNTRL